MKSVVGFCVVILTGSVLASPTGEVNVPTNAPWMSSMNSVTTMIGKELERYTPSLLTNLFTSMQNLTSSTKPSKVMQCSVPLVQQISFNTVTFTLDLVKILKDELYAEDPAAVALLALSPLVDPTGITKGAAIESNTQKVLMVLSRSLKPISKIILESIQGLRKLLQCIGFFMQQF